MNPLRILITGSRYWRDEKTIALAISGWLESVGTSIGRAYPIPVIVHGGQRSQDEKTGEYYGADWYAGCIARNWGFGEERHSADWDRYGRSAGPRRNAAMVNLGADVCLAFPIGRSVGTRGCIRLAGAAGIPVVVHEGAHDGGSHPEHPACDAAGSPGAAGEGAARERSG